jgi:hypothetical protein
VSSILRALKKLDEDSLSQANPRGDAKIKMRQLVDRKNRRPWQIHRVLVVLLVLLLSSTTVYLLIKGQGTGRQENIKKGDAEKVTVNPVAPPQRVTPAKTPVATVVAGAGTSEPRQPAPIPIQPLVQVAPSRPVVEPVITPTSPAEETETRSISKTNLPLLILNGTLWSETPERRVALINDRYLKEGDDLNGVTILQIAKNSVTLQRGQEKWTIWVKK